MQEKKCERCNGRGTVVVGQTSERLREREIDPEDLPPLQPYLDTEDCPVCGGSGKVPVDG